MSKAENLAKELFPLLETDKIGNNPYITYNTEQLAKQEGFVKGYRQAEKDLHKSIYKAGFLDGFEDAVEGQYEKGYDQAEKDLELTWEDMMIIHKCIKDAMNYHLYKMMEGIEGQKTVYEEVLKRFKAHKEK